jgi:carbonic anhydrase
MSTRHPHARTPVLALQSLYAGNERFVRGTTNPAHRDVSRLKAVAYDQTPFAAFLGCADSRVPIEIIFDQGFGDVFVTRNAGNVADPVIMASLEFGTEVLGAQVLYILGHSRCGAVSATIEERDAPGHIGMLFEYIQRAVTDANGDLTAAIARNVQIQAELLLDASPIIAKRVAEGTLLMAGGVYDLDTGRVSPVSLERMAISAR